MTAIGVILIAVAYLFHFWGSEFSYPRESADSILFTGCTGLVLLISGVNVFLWGYMS